MIITSLATISCRIYSYAAICFCLCLSACGGEPSSTNPPASVSEYPSMPVVGELDSRHVDSFSPSATSDASIFSIVEWPKVIDASSYHLVLSTNPNLDAPIYSDTVISNRVQMPRLIRKQTYYWKVDSFNASGQLLNASAIQQFTVSRFDKDDIPYDIFGKYDYSGMRDVGRVPDSGVHPRLFFSPEDLPAIRERLKNTKSGRAASAQIQAYMKLFELGYDGGCATGKYCRTADYAVDARGRARIGNIGLHNVGSVYKQLLAGDTPDPFSALDRTKTILFCGMLAIRAFDSLVNEDTIELENVAKAIDASINEFKKPNRGDEQCYYHLALGFDFAANVMTPAQKNNIKQAFVDHIKDHEHYGAYTHNYATTSNWVALISFKPLIAMVIDGEVSGLPSKVIDSLRRAYYNFVTYGFYPSGAGWEGMGKNYMYVTTMIALERRGEKLLGHPHIRAFAESFLPALTQPFGYGFTAYDSLAGTGYRYDSHDAIGLKWVFPESKKVDFMWRNFLGHPEAITNPELRTEEATGYNYQQFTLRGYHNALLVAAIFASDFDENTNWDSAQIPLTYKAFDRGLVHTRSSNQDDAMQLMFHVRQDFGGHTNADRLNVNISALGRPWGVYRREVNGGTTGNPHEMRYYSTVLIDDKGVRVNPKEGVKARQPGTLVEVIDNAKATIATGDATWAYRYELDWSPGKLGSADNRLNDGWEQVSETFNDFRVTPGDEPFLNIPLYDFPGWNSDLDDLERLVKRQWLDVHSVTRTAALVRSIKPYSLVLDDVSMRDGAEHNYKWQLQIDSEITIESTNIAEDANGFRRDIILREPAEKGDRRFLIRVLKANGLMSMPGTRVERHNPRSGRESEIWPAIVLEAVTADNPEFTVLMYAFNAGDPIPITQWVNDALLSVKIEGREDLIRIVNKHNGRSIEVN